MLSDDVYVYREDERSYYALNVAVTADNYKDYMDSTMVYAPVSNQLDEATSPVKKVWLNIYNSSDNFLGSPISRFFRSMISSSTWMLITSAVTDRQNPILPTVWAIQPV